MERGIVFMAIPMRLKPSVLPWYTAMQKWNFLFAFSKQGVYMAAATDVLKEETKVSCQGVHVLSDISHTLCARTEPVFMALFNK